MQKHIKIILTTNELSERLNLSHTTIWRLRRSGKIPFFKAGKTVLFDYNEVLESLKKTSFVGGQNGRA